MKWNVTLGQTIIATLIWGAGMHFFFAWPREELLIPMAFFAVTYWVIGRVISLLFNKKDSDE